VSLLSPVLAVQRLSAGIAGTDLMAQQTFASAAEEHRRRIIGELNHHMMVNAGDEGYAYMAGRDLWEATPDFTYEAPALSRVLAHYMVEIVALFGWLIAFGALALRATRDALARGA
jgi:ABC-2 type transport system permease protein